MSSGAFQGLGVSFSDEHVMRLPHAMVRTHSALAPATDADWRVRYALIQVLLEWGLTAHQREEIVQRLARLQQTARVQGVREYLRYRWSGIPPQKFPNNDLVDPSQSAAFWDWD